MLPFFSFQIFSMVLIFSYQYFIICILNGKAYNQTFDIIFHLFGTRVREMRDFKWILVGYNLFLLVINFLLFLLVIMTSKSLMDGKTFYQRQKEAFNRKKQETSGLRVSLMSG